MEAQQKTLEEQLALPEIKARVRSAPVDMISVDQGTVLLNKLNYVPRPVIQSYSAYTPYLEAKNARFFQLDSAPPYIVFKLDPIDERFPMSEDGPALMEVFRRYRPVAMEKGFLLLERCGVPNPSPPPAGKDHMVHRVRFGEQVSVPDFQEKLHEVRITIKPSLAGRLRKALYQPPLVDLHVRTSQDQELTFRLVPSMVETGFLINPLVLGTGDVVNLFGDGPGERVKDFWVSTHGRAFFEDEIAVTLIGFSELLSPEARAHSAEVNKFRYQAMKTPPLSVRSSAQPPRIIEVDGKEVLLVHADGELQFGVPEGSRTVSGKFGIVPAAYEAETDGVQFTVALDAEGEAPVVLYERYLDPRARAEDRGMQEFAVALPANARGKLVLKTFTLSGKNGQWDWSYWSAVEIK